MEMFSFCFRHKPNRPSSQFARIRYINISIKALLGAGQLQLYAPLFSTMTGSRPQTAHTQSHALSRYSPPVIALAVC